MKPSTSAYRITVAAVLAVGCLGTSELPATASPKFISVQHPSSSPQELLIAGELRFNPKIRPSRYRIGGFYEGVCSPVDIAVVSPVSPPTQPEERSPGNDVAVDSTVSAHPTLFVNIPAELPSTTAELVVQNEMSEQELYATKFNLTNKPGIVGIRIPDTAPALEVGQKYFWQVSIPCNPDDPTVRIDATGWIERVQLDPTLANRIEQATPRKKLALYAEAGIWQDTLSTLAELLYSNPNDQSLTQDWVSLMQSVNLNDLANQPIVQITGQ